MKSGFLSRLLERAEKIDKERIVDYMTEIAQERDLLMLIFDSMTEGMIVIDQEERVLYINPSARRIIGAGDGPSAPELPLRSVLDRDSLLSLCRRGVESAEPLINQEYSLSLPEDQRILKVSMIPLRRADRRFGTLFLFNDETDAIRREQKLREAEKLAALTTLSAGMSHEIRNPLNSLSIHLQLLDRQLRNNGVYDEGIRETVHIFSNEIKRLNEVIEVFLAAVRPSQPEFKLHNLYKLVTEPLTLMEPEFRENNIKLVLHEEGKWPLVEADSRQMTQVFINLLKNSIEAIVSQSAEERAGKTNEINIRMARDKGNVKLLFEDDGCGIPEEDLAHIFEPYFTNKPKGTGLGLMIVDRIVREHNGSITARSEPGEGTRIAVTLPVAAEEMPLLGRGGDLRRDPDHRSNF